ncbi:TasA family protein [Peribacillus glennii]|uniref:Cell division protein FtsN n=1 Tax=Peribacillus glennii TaxID=2303991 RepID=A0A372LGD3_9BACI|nr:TasA family protein [Peribacillus glennii]RFU65365.1 hypothetical protein D0466_05585 [Peribacillus glennii]
MSIKKKIGGALLGTAMGAALIGGGTFALFTAEASNSGNTFTAGTVKINDISGGAVLSTTANIGNLAPGDTDNATLTIENKGTLDAWVKLDNYTTNANATFKDGTGDLFEGSTPVTITHDQGAVKVPKNGTATFNVAYSFPKAANNDYQAATGTVTFNVKAVQARNNTKTDDSGPKSWNQDASE